MRSPSPARSAACQRAWCRWLLLTLALLALVAHAAASESARYRIGVLDFDVNDLTAQLPDAQRAALGRAMAAAFEAPLVQARRFTVVTRVDLEKVLDEIALGSSGLLDPEQAQAFGRLAGVDIIVTGTISVFTTDALSVSTRFIDVSTGAIAVAETQTAASAAEFSDAAHAFVERALERFPLQGSIIAIEGDDAFIDLGSDSGLTSDDRVGIIERTREVAGRTFSSPIGTFTVLHMDTGISLVRAELDDGYELVVGDRATISEAPAPPTPPVGVDPSDVTDAEPAAPPAPPPATLQLHVRPAEAQVSVDGVDLEQPAEALTLPAGSYRITARAAGFVPYAQDIHLAAGDSVDLRIDLEPARGRLQLEIEPPEARVTIDGSLVSARTLELPPGPHRVRVDADGFLPHETVVDVTADATEILRVTLAPAPVPDVVEPDTDADVDVDAVAVADADTDADVDVGVDADVDADAHQHTPEPNFILWLEIGTSVLVTPAGGNVRSLGTTTEATHAHYLPPGEYQVLLSSEREPWRRITVQVPLEGHITIGDPGTLTVSVVNDPYDVDVVLSDASGVEQYRGPAPDALPLDPGSYTIHPATGDVVSTSASIRPREAAEAVLDLTDHYGYLDLVVEHGPAGIRMLVLDADGVEWHRGALPRRLPLAPGTYTVRTESDETIATTATLVAGRNTTATLDASDWALSVASVVAGRAHSLAALDDGTVWAWGSNSSGQLGDGSTTNRTTPVQVIGLTNVHSIAAGTAHSLTVLDDGTVWAWGSNSLGQLGDGSTTNHTTPVQVLGLTNVHSIAAGSTHSLAVRDDGTVWAWGNNNFGRLGDGSTTNRTTPVQVVDLTNVRSIATGWDYSLAVREDGTLWAWGHNGSGRLGDGSTTNRTTPVQVIGLTNVHSIAAGSTHSFAVLDNGTVWAWGNNGSGRLGDGSTTNRTRPVRVVGLTNVHTIVAGTRHSLATREDGSVFAWGENASGQLGDGTTTTRTTPVQIVGLTNVHSIAAGSTHSFAVLDDGTIWAWGNNVSGQLGDGSTMIRLTPVQVEGLVYLLSDTTRQRQ